MTANTRSLRCRNDALHVQFKAVQDFSVKYLLDVSSDFSVSARTQQSVGNELTEMLDDLIVCDSCKTIVHAPRLPINFVPDQGMVLLCSYAGFQKPEMTKVRPVVVLSPKMRNGFTVMVAAISTSVPANHRSVVVDLPEGRYPFLKSSSLVKCEMVNTVGLARLFLLRGPDGRAIHSTQTLLDPEDMAKVRSGILKGIGG